jgi:hypothetical protein
MKMIDGSSKGTSRCFSASSSSDTNQYTFKCKPEASLARKKFQRNQQIMIPNSLKEQESTGFTSGEGSKFMRRA